MTTITKEWLQQTIAEFENTRDDIPFGLNDDDAKILIVLKRALAALTAEPVSWTDEEELRDLRKVGFCEMFSVEPISKDADMLRVIPLYRHAQPAPVVPDGLRQALSNAGIAAPESDEMLAATCEKYIQMLVTWVKDRKPFQPVPVVPAELHPDTQNLVDDFCTALAEKLYKAQLKYGYDADWKQDGWHTQCLAHFHQHIAKGDPRDVAAYCAFMWYHGWKTESVSGPVVPDYASFEEFWSSFEHPFAEDDELKSFAVEIWNACRSAMLQAGNHTEQHLDMVDHSGDANEKGSDGTFIDEGTKQAGNSPVQNPIDHGYRPECECSGCKATARICAELNNEEAEIFADGYNVALLQSKCRDLSQPVDPQISEYEKIMLRAGWVMVPIEPTDEMIAAAMECDDVVFDSKDPTAFCVQYREIYCAMVDVAPKPEGNNR